MDRFITVNGFNSELLGQQHKGGCVRSSNPAMDFENGCYATSVRLFNFDFSGCSAVR
jgi:hypothetical protein